ncbi:MAG TPA: serine/threonine-protein kinase, partial [Candidatus Eisenbacteria bacterium]
MTLLPGTRLGAYEIVAPLGAGGMGEVYRARDRKLHRDVAVKVLSDSLARDAESLSRFEREARLLAAVDHPNIAVIHAIETELDRPFLVMELIPGETLAERLAAGPLSVAEALAVAGQVANALEAAHEKGVVHRDLKPSNVVITPEGRVKVLDFGLAKSSVTAAGDSQLPTQAAEATRTGTVLGSPGYMSPEQARARPIDRRTDIWGLGCLLFECLAGRPAFGGES